LFAILPISAQNSKPAPPKSSPPEDALAKRDADAEVELQKALASASNDSAALVRNLRDYLKRFPDAPRKAAVYRALVEACGQIRDSACALDYAERLIALHPDDSEMMLLAVDLLQQQGDDASLTRAAGYITRVLDRIEKSLPEERSARESLADWQAHRDTLRTALYYVRGQVVKSQHNYGGAATDFQMSYSIHPNALAAEKLGEIAELSKDSPKAIEEYTLAFVLPEEGPAGKTDRREVRMRLGNVWRQVHGNEQGLGEAILAAFDHLESPASNASSVARNKEAKELLAFVLRKMDGSSLPLETFKGKVVVLGFWATWCGPCHELEPLLVHVAKEYAGNPDVVFLNVNADEDQAQVPAFVAREKWELPVAYADGLDDFLKVETLPTVIILDRTGKISYRIEGFSPEEFSAPFIAAIQSALSPTDKR
jgi:thiol-disulfide isomerase/thioredoxin